MRKMLLVAVREFRQRMRTRGFLLGSIITPLLLILVWALSGAFGGLAPAEPSLLGSLGLQDPPAGVIGYVDQAGLIQRVPVPIPPGLFAPFPNALAADAALLAHGIEAYYVIPPDYQQTGAIQRVSLGVQAVPKDNKWFGWLLLGNLFPSAGFEELVQLRRPFGALDPQFVSLSRVGKEERQGSPMLPFLVSVGVMIPLFTGGALLLLSLGQEKSSRIMEVLLVSLRPRQLLAGKLLGLGMLTLVQYILWATVTSLALLLTGREASQFLSGINLSTEELLLVVPFTLGGYTLYAALMAGIGALARDLENSRGWAFMVGMPMMLPIYLWVTITTSPNGLLATTLSLIPFSAPVAMLMRMTSTTVPAWQVGASLALLLATAAVLVRLMARLFHVQTLLSGEPLSLRRIGAALSAREPQA